MMKTTLSALLPLLASVCSALTLPEAARQQIGVTVEYDPA